MGVQILNKDVSVISSILSKPKANIGNVGGIGGWAGGGPASQGPFVPATAVEINDGYNNWVGVNNIQNNTNDNIYAGCTLISIQQANPIKVTNFGFNIPTSATINGIIAQVNKFADNTYYDSNITLVKGGVQAGTNKASVYSWPANSLSPETYGSSTDLWGTTWSPADINNSNFGFYIFGYGSFQKHYYEVNLAWVKITVHYTT